MSDLPQDLKSNPRLSAWLRFESPGSVVVMSGKVELGQGILTANAQIAAEELGVELARVRVAGASTAASPDQFYTAGSLSVEQGGAALRQACAEARALAFAAAAERLGVNPGELEVRDGTFHLAEFAHASYWTLPMAELLARDATGAAVPHGERQRTDRSTPRFDLPAKIAGRPAYLHDLERATMLHGRVVRPPSPGAELLASGEEALAGLRGVCKLVREGDFLGVIAEREEQAVAAAERLRAASRWRESARLAECASLPEFVRGGRQSHKVIDSSAPARPAAAQRLTARYSRPFIAHASLAPSCAIACWRDARLEVIAHSQGIFPLARGLAQYFGIDAGSVVVEYAESAGCYGHNGHDDVAFDAALLARGLPGVPVRVQWSREDELGWAPFGPPALVELEAELDAQGRVQSWCHETWGTTHTVRVGSIGPSAFLGGLHREGKRTYPDREDQVGIMRNSVPGYDFPHRHVATHTRLDSPIRSGALRSLGAFSNLFAAESFMDELAHAANTDPLAFRLAHLSDPRGRAVLEAAAQAAAWGGPLGEAQGRGIAYSRYKNTGGWCAVVAEVDARENLRIRRLTLAVDCGLVVSPDGLRNQVEGGAIQAASWTLKEAVTFDERRITSTSWESYPILRFSEVPPVEVLIIDHSREPSLGAGEIAQGPTAAAIANALYAALGVRVRDLPLTRERIAAL